MDYMLDTNICIYLIKKKDETLIRRIESASPSSLFLSSVTVAELEYGVAKSQRPEQNRVALFLFLASLKVLPFGPDAAAHYGEVRAQLEREGRSIGPMDLMIAAHALAQRCTVVTNNEREFRRVSGLATENWTIPY